MAAADLNSLKERVAADVTARAGRLHEVAADIHARPELLYEERFAADLLASELEAAGDLTDDDDLKREGKIDKGTGKVKDVVDSVSDKLKGD